MRGEAGQGEAGQGGADGAEACVDAVAVLGQRRVREYMEFRSVPIPLQQRVFYHYRDVWSRSGEPYAELDTIRGLPSDLRKAVLSEVLESCCH
jgi:hypothetical protein